jgi:hypothetical protein
LAEVGFKFGPDSPIRAAMIPIAFEAEYFFSLMK